MQQAGQGDADAHWAAAVLGGQVQTRGPWRSPPGPQGSDRRMPQSRRDRQTTSRQQAGSGGAAAKAPPPRVRRRKQQQEVQQQQQKPRQRNKQQQQQQQQQPRPSYSSDDDSSSGGEGSTANLAAYSRPGPRSTAHVSHCTACDVFVPRRQGDWEVHVAGIRHRRQMLSLRVHGVPNRLVLSAFESLPDSADMAQRLVGKAARDFGLVPASGSARPAALGTTPEVLHAARQLRTEALGQLLSMFDRPTYNAAARMFEENRLAAAIQAAEQRLGQQQHEQHHHQQQQQQQQAQQQQAGHQAEQQAQQQVGPAQHWAAAWDASDGADLAAAAHLARSGRLHFAELAIQLLPTEGASRWLHASLAAGLALLLPALQCCGGLASVHLELPPIGSLDFTAHAHVAALWEVGWQRALAQVRDLLASGQVPLRALHLVLPAALADATADYMGQLTEAAREGARALRALLLLGLHPRVGRCSLLSLLPLEVLQQVLDLAAPLQPCVVQVSALPAE